MRAYLVLIRYLRNWELISQPLKLFLFVINYSLQLIGQERVTQPLSIHLINVIREDYHNAGRSKVGQLPAAIGIL